MRRDAEGQTGDGFDEERGLRSAIREVDVEMFDPVPGEKVSEIKRVPRTQRGLPDDAVALLVTGDERDRPTSFLLRATLADFQDLRWRRVENRRLKTGGVLVAQAGVRRMNRADLEGAAPALESKHFRVAKSLRNDRIP